MMNIFLNIFLHKYYSKTDSNKAECWALSWVRSILTDFNLCSLTEL